MTWYQAASQGTYVTTCMTRAPCHAVSGTGLSESCLRHWHICMLPGLHHLNLLRGLWRCRASVPCSMQLQMRPDPLRGLHIGTAKPALMLTIPKRTASYRIIPQGRMLVWRYPLSLRPRDILQAAAARQLQRAAAEGQTCGSHIVTYQLQRHEHGDTFHVVP